MVDYRLHIGPIPAVNLQAAAAFPQSTVPHTNTHMEAHVNTLSCGKAMISTYNVPRPMLEVELRSTLRYSSQHTSSHRSSQHTHHIHACQDVWHTAQSNYLSQQLPPHTRGSASCLTPEKADYVTFPFLCRLHTELRYTQDRMCLLYIIYCLLLVAEKNDITFTARGVQKKKKNHFGNDTFSCNPDTKWYHPFLLHTVWL